MLTNFTLHQNLKSYSLIFFFIFSGQFLVSAGDPVISYYVCDQGDVVYKINRTTSVITEIGDLNSGIDWVEAIEYDAFQDKLFGANRGEFGQINLSNGQWSSLGDIDDGNPMTGADGNVSASDVDGLAFDTWTGMVWASTRRSGDYDVLFKINPSNGNIIRDAFGTDIDYIVIDGTGVYQNMDDIAVNPLTGKIYASTTVSGAAQLIEINKFTGAVESAVALTYNDVEGLDISSDGQMYGTTGNTETLYEIALDGTMTKPVDLEDDNNCGDVEAIACTTAPANIINGKVWEDADGNQAINGESGIQGVTVNLYYDVNEDGQLDNGDILIQTIETKSNGDYSFKFGTNAKLVVAVDLNTLPVGYGFTTDNVEAAEFLTITTAETDSNNNFGLQTGSDCDGDGIPDFIEGTIDTDGDGISNKCDLDSDNDGILDAEEGYTDTDKDGVFDRLDKDSDNDGIPDAIEANFGAEGANYNTALGTLTGADDDEDGLIDAIDSHPTIQYGASTTLVSNSNNDGDLVANYIDLDADNDGILDVIEAGGVDDNGDGVIDGFSDTGDGWDDATKANPLSNPNTDLSAETTNGMPIRPDFLDIDADNDGIDDSREGWATTDYSLLSIILDADKDGIIDSWDISLGGYPIFPVDTDNDQTPDFQDTDSDDDSVLDNLEGHDANSNGVADILPSGNDTDMDGLDDNFDNVVGHIEENKSSSNAPVQDTDGTEDKDWRDLDDDGDTWITITELGDLNFNSIPDYLELSDAPLPVKLISFTGTEVDCRVKLSWITAEEENNDYFVVQRSLDGQHFKDLDVIRGSGTTVVTQHYGYTDQFPGEENYYRLKQVDFDGKYEFSKSISVKSSCFHSNYNVGLLGLYPNPIMDGQLTLKIEMRAPETSLITVADMYGKVMMVKEVNLDPGLNTLRLDIDNLAPGTYFVNAARKALKFVKIRD